MVSFNAGASPYGAHDMPGNVWEWVEDCYDAKAYARMTEEKPSNTECDKSARRVRRGGGFYYAAFLRAADRGYDGPAYSGGGLGFRCARSFP